MIKELGNSIKKTATTTKYDVDNLLRIEKQKREIAYGVIDASPIAAGIVISEEEAEAFYKKQKSQYTTPERVSIDYIELSVEELASTLDVSETVMEQFYTDNKGQFMSPEQRQASHILIEGDSKEAIKILTAVEYRLSQGEDFSSVAKELSQDPGSAQEGGDLGSFQRGIMEPAFENAVFSLDNVNDVSSIIKTDSGHHLVKLTGIVNSVGKDFSAVRKEIENNIRGQEAEQLFFEQAEKLAELSYENPDSLVLASEELALKIKTSKLFTREGGEGITADKNVVNIAFTDEVLLEGLNSTVIELTDSHMVVLHRNEHVLSGQLPFDVVSDDIKLKLKAQSAKNKATEVGEKLLEKVEDGTDVKSLFSKYEWHETLLIERSENTIDREILDEVYGMEKPNENSIYHGFTDRNGNYVLIRLTAVIEGGLDDASKEDRDGLSSYLVQHYGDSELRAFIESLKAESDIEISSDYFR
jgi:peptidyl-prolyl cis-trans isomerase D